MKVARIGTNRTLIKRNQQLYCVVVITVIINQDYLTKILRLTFFSLLIRIFALKQFSYKTVTVTYGDHDVDFEVT